MSLNCSGVQELIGEVWIPSNIETFSPLLLLLPKLISNLQVTIAKHHRTSSCILPRRRQMELLRQFPEGLFDHVVAIGSLLLTFDNTFDHVIFVFQCLSILARTGIETEDSVTAGFSRGLASATSLAEALCSSSLVSIDSVTYSSSPPTIRTQAAVWS